MTVEWSHWLAQSWRNCKNNCQNPNQDCKNKKLERIGAQKDPGKLEPIEWVATEVDESRAPKRIGLVAFRREG